MEPALATIQRFALRLARRVPEAAARPRRGGGPPCGRCRTGTRRRRCPRRAGPPRERGTTWSMFSAARLQYWQRWPSRAKTARRESGTRLRYGTRTKWCEPDHRRAPGSVSALGVQHGAVARDDLGLLLQHEHDGPAHRHDAERLEAGVEQQGSSQASGTSTGRRATVASCHRARDRRPSRRVPMSRHHSRYVDQVVRVGAAVGAVLGLEPEPQVVGVGHGQERRPPPPPRPGEPDRLAQRGRPEPRARQRRAAIARHQNGAPGNATDGSCVMRAHGSR